MEEVLIKNSIKCLLCNTVLTSTHRHDWVQCNCPNKAFTDGGLSYVRVGAMDLTKVQDLCEWEVKEK